MGTVAKTEQVSKTVLLKAPAVTVWLLFHQEGSLSTSYAGQQRCSPTGLQMTPG
jgi:hypothetical protein